MTRAKYSTFHIFILFRRADIINSFCHLDLIWQSWVWLDFDWQNWIKVVNISSVLVHTKELIAIWKLLLLSGMLKNDAISKRLIYVWKNGEIKIRFFLPKMKRILFLQLCSIENLVFFSAVLSSSFYFPITLFWM